MNQSVPDSTAKKPSRADGPSMRLTGLFTVLMSLVVLSLVGFVGAVSAGSQAALDFFTKALLVTLSISGLFLLYGALVGVYHTILAIFGFDRGKAQSGT
jgi:hypothetical protein